MSGPRKERIAAVLGSSSQGPRTMLDPGLSVPVNCSLSSCPDVGEDDMGGGEDQPWREEISARVRGRPGPYAAGAFSYRLGHLDDCVPFVLPLRTLVRRGELPLPGDFLAVALLLADDDLVAPGLAADWAPVRWGHTSDLRPRPNCQAIGFPAVQRGGSPRQGAGRGYSGGLRHPGGRAAPAAPGVRLVADP